MLAVDVKTIPTLGLSNDNVDVVIAEPDPIKNSEVIKIFFFAIKFFISFYNIHLLF